MIKEDGYPYAFDPSACAGCGGRCCTGESGNIFVSPDEIQALAAALEMEEPDFRRTYLEKRGYKFSLKERIVGMSHDCVFFDRETNGCRVYTARPAQCRTFPFWEYYKTRVDELKRECPGIVDV
ncbi:MULTISPECIES: YkgJ family cysteine cluster protein [Sulfurimonadaceae]|uniref:YkgJ family cysteine cluster protein n=1 Tax=Sulfurimonadaceae TaxID=2771471 RepID=UPI0032E36856